MLTTEIVPLPPDIRRALEALVARGQRQPRWWEAMWKDGSRDAERLNQARYGSSAAAVLASGQCTRFTLTLTDPVVAEPLDRRSALVLVPLDANTTHASLITPHRVPGVDTLVDPASDLLRSDQLLRATWTWYDLEGLYAKYGFEASGSPVDADPITPTREAYQVVVDELNLPLGGAVVAKPLSAIMARFDAIEDFWIGVTGVLFEPSSHADLEHYRGKTVAVYFDKLIDLYTRSDQTVEVRQGILDLLQDHSATENPSLKPLAEHALTLSEPVYQAIGLSMLSSPDIFSKLFDEQTSSIDPVKVRAAVAKHFEARLPSSRWRV